LDEFVSSGRTDNVAALFEGYIYLEPSLEEMICVTSDDGSKLYLNDTLVIDNDGLHGMQKKCASIPTEGVYKLDLEYFENGGSSGLTLAFEKIVHPMTWVSMPPMTPDCVDSPLGWHDINGPFWDCDWYSSGKRCSVYGNGWANNGITANMACCRCGGGSYAA